MGRIPGIYIPLLVMLGVTVVGICGYMAIEGYSFIEALYMTVITVTTVGFGEVKPLSENGRMFTIFLLVASIGTFAYALSEVSRTLLEGQFRRYLLNWRVDKDLSKLTGHTIVCGYGRNGQQAVKTLIEHKMPYVVIEKDHDRLKTLENKGVLFVEGDATKDELLNQVGISRAKALISTLPNDADNLYVVLSARVLRPDLTIISRASDDGADNKLRHAGANSVIMPDRVGGAHMAQLVVQPDLVEFIDSLKVRSGDQVLLDEVACPETNGWSAQLKSICEGANAHMNIMGLKDAQGNFSYNPAPNTLVMPGTKLFVLGTNEQIAALQRALHAQT